ncbi:hypothetical protein B296_00026841 [Ensete ventricosum]|uniref:Retrotransposon gag domain-containing protein n=1 Tax=Ensete ventricosum TaxID=4639 RepID=A0A426ZEZ4_ENSVE|nr:hypothetical protein B296_00026841 [Ensete ventricosum]
MSQKDNESLAQFVTRCSYRFHRDYGHNTEECYDLKNQIEDLNCRGHLSRHVRRSREPSLHPNGPVEKQINVIIGGPTSGGDNPSACKAYAQTTIQKRPRQEPFPEITFRSGEEEYPDHDDALVISTRIANARVKRIMVDTGSSTDILYFDVFQKLGLIDRDLIPMISTLIGFTRDTIAPLGITTLPLTVGEELRTKTVMVSFMVVKVPSAYNAIIDRPTLNRLRATVSTYHRTMKFPTNAGVSKARSDPQESR